MDDLISEGCLDAPGAFDEADDDVIQSFQLDVSSLRGRAVRLGSALNDILEPHDYPNPVAHLVAETVTVTLLLSSMLKFDGIFTLQIRGDGPVSLLVADMTSEGQIRGCAHFDSERLEQARAQLLALKAEETSRNHLAQYLGKGYVAFTVDQGEAAERYQGVVELRGASLVDCVQHYFNQSEQIISGIKMAVGQRGGVWRAGGVMLQKMPDGDGYSEIKGNMDEDDWRRAMILLESCTEDEFLDPNLHSNALLTRLFHEEDVRVFQPVNVFKGCRCSEEKVCTMLTMMSVEDLDYMAEDGRISMRCEFCSQEYSYAREKFPAS
ncbi:MAG TPA: Hsp33 family molecular chaperone HslO [Alphaproteobacteria bacterium]|nr:Hsp33 family molecular chaperone HslO [Alphaproteobacteria bacterium]USO06022.1 MAG: Hsp33 family molecular chaperone HslO [Rhodospirillales bacterium]HOO81764.1 Hsp33 family molecular chaperone HslO [Alphaproteobacteria bacterium]